MRVVVTIVIIETIWMCEAPRVFNQSDQQLVYDPFSLKGILIALIPSKLAFVQKSAGIS